MTDDATELLTRILPGYRGKVEVFGRDLGATGDDFFNRIGVCFEFPNLYEKLTAEENLEFYGGFFDVPSPWQILLARIRRARVRQGSRNA